MERRIIVYMEINVEEAKCEAELSKKEKELLGRHTKATAKQLKEYISLKREKAAHKLARKECELAKYSEEVNSKFDR